MQNLSAFSHHDASEVRTIHLLDAVQSITLSNHDDHLVLTVTLP